MSDIKAKYIQAFIGNFTYFGSLDELKYSTRDNMTALLHDAKFDCVSWTVPRWSHKGDIILFMYSKKAIQRINAIEKEAKQEPIYARRKNNRSMNPALCLAIIGDAKENYKKYGGKIVGFGKLKTDPELGDSVVGIRTGADIEDVHILENPLPCSNFTSFLRISQGGMTSVWGEWYEKIKQMIIDTNDDLPEYFLESVSMTEEQSRINSNNWLKENLNINFNYKKEEAFRTFYVDYLLRELSDDGEFYTECACYKNGLKSPSYADYFISISEKWLPVETKINIGIERNLDYQVSKYCELEEVILDPINGVGAANEDLIQTRVLIIDERQIQMYEYENGMRFEVAELKDIRNKKDIQSLRKRIISML